MPKKVYEKCVYRVPNRFVTKFGKQEANKEEDTSVHKRGLKIKHLAWHTKDNREKLSRYMNGLTRRHWRKKSKFQGDNKLDPKGEIDFDVQDDSKNGEGF